MGDSEESEEITSIQVRESTWSALNSRKSPGDTFDDVISRLLEESDV